MYDYIERGMDITLTLRNGNHISGTYLDHVFDTNDYIVLSVDEGIILQEINEISTILVQYSDKDKAKSTLFDIENTSGSSRNEPAEVFERRVKDQMQGTPSSMPDRRYIPLGNTAKETITM